MAEIVIPESLLPADGRFGSGPTKVRPEAIAALAATGRDYLGTSHRQEPVRAVVRRIRTGLAELFRLPEGYEVALGNGGSTAFFDIAAFCLVQQRAQHLSFGEFGAKFAAETSAAPFLETSSVITAPAGTLAAPVAEAGVDTYCWPQNETSTGVMAPVRRVPGADEGAIVVIDATSAAGGIPVDPREFDGYFFAPQKNFSGDAGLWLALLSPAAVDRASRIVASGRWVPAFLDLVTAIENAKQDQSLNTPALATLFLLADQIEWLLDRGGLDWATQRTAESSSILYNWAEKSPFATPFVAEPDARSQVVATIDFVDVEAAAIAATLRRNGIVDTEPYRKLGRNQLRIATYVGIEPGDVEALTGCIDYVVDKLG